MNCRKVESQYHIVYRKKLVVVVSDKARQVGLSHGGFEFMRGS